MARLTAALATVFSTFLVWTVDVTDARAQVVFEQYDAPRPPEADAIMEVLRDEFGHNSIVARPEYLSKSLFHAPRPAIQDSTLTSEALIDELELAVKSYIKVNYPLALVQLANALTHADSNYGLIVQDPKAKNAMSRAQVALALTYKKQAEKLAEKLANSRRPTDPKVLAEWRVMEAKALAERKDLEGKAREAMTTYIRSSREPVARVMFGPPGEDLYNEVRKTLDPTKRGTLTVKVNEPDAQLFVNGQPVGLAAFSGDQLPGPYCVVVRVDDKMLRYNVIIAVDQPITLDIDWGFDSALRLSDKWVGLMQPKGTPTQTYVRSMSQRMGGQISLIFVGLRQEPRHLTVYGYYYERAHAGGILRRSGEAHVTSVREETTLRDFVRFLATGKLAPGILPIGATETLSNDQPRRSRWLAYGAIAGATGAITAGTYSLLQEYDCNQDPNCKSKNQRADVIGYTGIGIGVALAVFAVYWLETSPASTQRSAVMLTPSTSGAMVTWMKEF